MALLSLKNPKLILKVNKTSYNENENSNEEKSESIHVEVAEFIDCILTAAVIAHKMHLRTKSFAEHKALNELYDELPENADAIAEAYQGKMGVILPDIDSVNQAQYLQMNCLDYVNYLISYVETNRQVFGNVSAIQNLVDELLHTLYSAAYKLKFLS